MLHGLPVSEAEEFVYQHYITLFQLLEIGIPYTQIYEMDEDEVTYILATHAAINEKRNER